MSIKYTLTLETDGKEVWKRWTGDREEMLRLAAPALVDMGVSERVGQMFLLNIQSAQPGPDGNVGTATYSRDLRSTLWFDARSTGKA